MTTVVFTIKGIIPWNHTTWTPSIDRLLGAACSGPKVLMATHVSGNWCPSEVRIWLQTHSVNMMPVRSVSLLCGNKCIFNYSRNLHTGIDSRYMQCNKYVVVCVYF